MIPVEDNWLHIKHEFHEACSNLNNNSFIDNLMTFRNLGLFKLLLDKKYNGLSGHPQDFLECILAIAEHDVTVAHEFAKIGSMPFLIQQFSEQTADLVYKDSPDEIIVKTNAEAPEYADWVIRTDAGSYMLGRNYENFKPEHVQKFRNLLDPQHDNYILKLSWFQLYNRVLVCSHLGGLQRIINVAMQHNTHQGFIGIAAQELDAMRLVMHRNINHALLHLKHNEQIPMFDRTKYKLQASVVPANVVNCVSEFCYLSDEIESIIDKLEQLDLEHLIDEHQDGVNHIEQLKGNDSTDLFL
jgi:hypothetical protein|tara:strand:- start:5014 stop:5910 length:897 start_codon:yes stop_codon:yes gene_type:complete